MDVPSLDSTDLPRVLGCSGGPLRSARSLVSASGLCPLYGSALPCGRSRELGTRPDLETRPGVAGCVDDWTSAGLVAAPAAVLPCRLPCRCSVQAVACAGRRVGGTRDLGVYAREGIPSSATFFRTQNTVKQRAMESI